MYEFRSETHPLAVLLKDCHAAVNDITEPLYKQYHELVDSCVRVPFPLANAEEPETEELELPSSASSESLDDGFERNCNLASNEVKAAMYKTDKEISILLNNESAAEGTKANSKDEALQSEEKDDMDSLFDSDEEDCLADSDMSSEVKEDNGAKLENQSVSATVDETKLEALEELQSSQVAYNEQLNVVTKCVHEASHSLRTLLMLAFEELNSTEGYDLITSIVQELLFADIGEHIQLLYR